MMVLLEIKSSQLIQFTYGEDGLAGENVEKQSIISFQPSNLSFERLCKFDLSLGEKYLRQFLTDDVMRDLYTNESLQILEDVLIEIMYDKFFQLVIQIKKKLFYHAI
jgi:hypothetical protein